MMDSELLRRFVDGGDQASFEALVTRYGSLVYSAACRQLGGDEHAAKDVAQEVFLDLARKARQLQTYDCIAGWLHGAVTFAAREMNRMNARRQRREAQAMEFEQTREPTRNWERIRPAIDAVLEELDERDREIVLLRFFAARSFGEIALTFHITENAAQKAVARSLDLLAAALSRRGVTLGVALIAAALPEGAFAVPPSLLRGIRAAVTPAHSSAAAIFMKWGMITLVASACFVTAYWLGLESGFTRAYAELGAGITKSEHRAQAAEARTVDATRRAVAAEAALAELRRPVPQRVDVMPVAKPLLPPAQRNVVILGQVKMPGRFVLLADDLTLTALISQAGGFTAVALQTAVKISRPQPNQSPKVLTVDATTDTSFVCHPGDTVYVPERIL